MRFSFSTYLTYSHSHSTTSSPLNGAVPPPSLVRQQSLRSLGGHTQRKKDLKPTLWPEQYHYICDHLDILPPCLTYSSLTHRLILHWESLSSTTPSILCFPPTTNSPALYLGRRTSIPRLQPQLLEQIQLRKSGHIQRRIWNALHPWLLCSHLLSRLDTGVVEEQTLPTPSMEGN